ncbi:sensor histidine kinase [Bowmanella dokdonensis]|uniref:Histidine kinase n=1 Tax=Bowmanella dokdonensis TaxID=751969 RepID=A0A939DMG1_9ALTE|nr:histidine kinase [Bowmanella dokdonensis]MBN7825337.1 histidine kinase [Bowmanella dokdonensis]
MKSESASAIDNPFSDRSDWNPQTEGGGQISPQTPRHVLINKPSFWLCHSGGWAFYYLSMSLDNIFLLQQYNQLGSMVLVALLPIALLGMLMTWPLRFLYQRCWNLSVTRLALVAMAASLLVACAWVVPKNLILWVSQKAYTQGYVGLEALWLEFQSAEFSWLMLFMTVSQTFFTIMVWSSLYFGINYYFRLLESQAKQLSSARLGHLAQIRMLRYQINPHFLFNTLNAISTLVMREDKQLCSKMVSQLATFLRYSLDSDPEKKIRLQDELKALLLYLDIEKTRFGNRLELSLAVSKEAEHALVPSLILQPLVENAIKHAIAKLARGGEIRIRAWIDIDVYLEVEDNGPLNDLSGVKAEGVGLNNIAERLSVLYGEHQSMTLRLASPQGLCVRLRLPLETEQHE